MRSRNKLVRLAAPALGLLLIAHSGCGSQEEAIFDEQSDAVASEQEGEEFDSQEEDSEESDVADAREGGQDLEDEEFVDDEDSMDGEASDEEDVDDIPDPPAEDDQGGAPEDDDADTMDRATLTAGCELMEGDFWEEEEEFGCELGSGHGLVCNDGGACVPAVTMSLDDILAQLGILEYYPSILELRAIATFNNGQGPMSQPGEIIVIVDDGWCSSPGNVFVEVNGTTECQCDSGFLQVGTESDGDPMCGLDWNDGGGNNPPPPPPPPPPPEPDPEPTCTQSELLQDLERAERDYVHCISGAIDSLQSSLQLATVALGSSMLTLGATAGVVLGELGATTLVGLSLSNEYDGAVKSCEYDFCTSIKRTLEDCNIPVPADPPDTLCDESW